MQIFPKTKLSRISFYIILVIFIWISWLSPWTGSVVTIIALYIFSQERKHWKTLNKSKGNRDQTKFSGKGDKKSESKIEAYPELPHWLKKLSGMK